jgi:hypothetical protein
VVAVFQYMRLIGYLLWLIWASILPTFILTRYLFTDTHPTRSQSWPLTTDKCLWSTMSLHSDAHGIHSSAVQLLLPRLTSTKDSKTIVSWFIFAFFFLWMFTRFQCIVTDIILFDRYTFVLGPYKGCWTS